MKLRTLAFVPVFCLLLLSCKGNDLHADSDSLSGASQHPNGVDSLETEDDVLAFLRTVPGCGATKFPVYYNETRSTADSLHTRSWVKTDLDRNGETDLLVFRAEGLSNICALLSFGGHYRKVDAKYWCKYQFIYPLVRNVGGQPLVLLYSQDQTGYDERVKHFTYTKLTCDTLVVQDTMFLNYVPKPGKHVIEKIGLYNDGMCEGECPRIVIHIDAKTMANTCTQELPWDHDVVNYTGQLSETQVKRLLRLLAQSDFTHYKENYEVGCSDQPTSTLTITYDGGKTKVIRDYGSAGNFTLSEFYEIAYAVEWKKK